MFLPVGFTWIPHTGMGSAAVPAAVAGVPPATPSSRSEPALWWRYGRLPGGTGGPPVSFGGSPKDLLAVEMEKIVSANTANTVRA